MHLFIGAVSVPVCTWIIAGIPATGTMLVRSGPGSKACSCGNQGCWSTWGAGQDAVALGVAALMILAQISPDYEALLKPQ